MIFGSQADHIAARLLKFVNGILFPAGLACSKVPEVGCSVNTLVSKMNCQRGTPGLDRGGEISDWGQLLLKLCLPPGRNDSYPGTVFLKCSGNLLLNSVAGKQICILQDIVSGFRSIV